MTTYKLSSLNFKFEQAGYGHYRVTYTTPNRGDYWVTTTDAMQLIDDTKHEEEPSQEAWHRLRKHVQLHGSHHSKNGTRLD